MANPYSAPELTPGLAAEERQRPKFWRGLLTAYAVHHLFAVVGMLTGVIVKPSEWPRFFPLDKPLEALANLVFILLLDLFVVLEPVLWAVVAQRDATFWHWLRIPVTLIIPIAGFMYARSRRRDWLWVIAVVSFGVFLSFVLWFDLWPALSDEA